MEIKKNLYRGLCNWGFPVLLSVSLFASCKDDLQTSVYTGPGIRFSVTDGALWHATRAAGNPVEETASRDSLLGVLPLHAGDGGEGLYLHTLLSDNTGNALSDDERILTRSAPVTDMTTYGNFGVFAYLYTGAWDASAAPDFMYNMEVRGQGGVWSPAADHNWPGKGKKLRFFAYAPYNTPGIGLPAQHKAGYPDFTYTVPEKVQDQKDLLVAASGEVAGDHNAAAALTFRHALTAVRFVVGDDMQKGKVTGITLRGVYGKAVYSMEADSWSAFEEKRDFSQELDKKVDGQTGEEITPVAGTFMMIPQQLPEGAGIEVAFTDDLTGTVRTLTAPIAGATWLGGKTVTYRISTSSISVVPTFTVTAPEDFTYEGGDKNYSVTSYASVSRAGDPTKTVPMSWTAEFVEDDGSGGYRVIDCPDWLTAFTANGNGGTSAATHSATITAQQYIRSNPHNDRLKKASPVSEFLDLSEGYFSNYQRESANCYIINAPGKFRLPLVYGNALQLDGEYSTTYTSSISEDKRRLKHFVNHLDKPITNAWIPDNEGCTPKDALLLWQDEPDLVTNVQLMDDGRHLSFEVPQATIKQGNAVVAVRDASDKIMWSWHIWVTDYISYPTGADYVGYDATEIESDIGVYNPMQIQNDKSVTNFQKFNHTFMGVNIGWCYDDILVYEARSVKVRFTQAETGATQVITLTQKRKSITTGGNNVFFQHGRKDPMLGVTQDGSDKKSYSDTGYNYNENGVKKTPVSIGTSIQYPNYFFAPFNGNRNWCSLPYYNLWSIDNEETMLNSVMPVKTIYDPSPAGYCVPPTQAYTGFTSDGLGFSGNGFGSRFNSPYTSKTEFHDNLGWVFYCQPMKEDGSYDTSGGVIFFPSVGARLNSDGGATGYSGSSRYWGCHPSADDAARSLILLEDRVGPAFGSYSFCGLSIRPVMMHSWQ